MENGLVSGRELRADGEKEKADQQFFHNANIVWMYETRNGDFSFGATLSF